MKKPLGQYGPAGMADNTCTGGLSKDDDEDDDDVDLFGSDDEVSLKVVGDNVAPADP